MKFKVLKPTNKIGTLELIGFGFLGTVIAVSLIAISLKISDKEIALNYSDSLPNYFFVVEKNLDFSKGDLVQFEHISIDKKFYRSGTKMIKKIIGVEGDVITFSGQDFYVNAKYFGTAKKLSTKGIPLEKNISKTLGQDEYFVWTPSKDSFDSRYAHVGYINKNQIKAKVIGAF